MSLHRPLCGRKEKPVFSVNSVLALSNVHIYIHIFINYKLYMFSVKREKKSF